MQKAGPEYVVHMNRSRLNRRQGLFIGLLGFLAVLLVCLYGWFFSMFPDMAGTWFIVFVLLLLGPLVQIIILAWGLGRMNAISRPMVITPEGIELHTVDGYVRLPWRAIEAITPKTVLMSRLLAVRVNPGASQDPNVVAEVTPRVWQRITKHGVLTNTDFIVEPLPEVMHVIMHHAAGRTRVGP